MLSTQLPSTSTFTFSNILSNTEWSVLYTRPTYNRTPGTRTRPALYPALAPGLCILPQASPTNQIAVGSILLSEIHRAIWLKHIQDEERYGPAIVSWSWS